MEPELSQCEKKEDLDSTELSLVSKEPQIPFVSDRNYGNKYQVLQRRKPSENEKANGDQSEKPKCWQDDVNARKESDVNSFRSKDEEDKEENRFITDSYQGPNEEVDEESVPDGGWGWVVVFGGSLIVVLVDTMGQCFGILFSTFLLELNTPTVVTAWIFNLYQFLYNMTGPVLGPLVAQFGWRTLAMISSFILAVGTITSAFVESAYVLFLTYSLLVGVGSGVLSNISYVIVPHYFKARRGLANGIIMAWDCGGQFIGAPLIKILQDEYAFEGATLIIGGIVLNCCVGAAVFHPVKWHMKTKPSISTRKAGGGGGGGGGTQLQKISLEQNDSCEKTSHSKSQRNIILHLMESVIADLAILKSAKAVIIALTTTVTFIGYLNFLALVPFAMQEAGYTLGDAAICVSLSAICNIVTRLVVAAFSDTKIFNFRITMMIGSLVISGSMLCFTFADSLALVKVAMAIWGCGVGSFNGIFNLVMIHYMGLDGFMPMFGASLFITSFGYLLVGPLAGYIRDISGSYAVCIWILTGISLSSFILWLFMPVAESYDLRLEKKKRKEKINNTHEIPSAV